MRRLNILHLVKVGHLLTVDGARHCPPIDLIYRHLSKQALIEKIVKNSDMSSPTQTNPQAVTHFFRRKLPELCVAFSSDEGREIFTEALLKGHMQSYFRLAEQFRTQDEPAYCGLTTLVMVLNTLAVDPGRVWKGVWRWYHEDMLDCCVPLKVVQQQGITLDQFVCLAVCNQVCIQVFRINDDITIDDFRRALNTISQNQDKVMVCSYSRKILGQTGDGHFSPIGGYNPERDMLLVFDVARFKYPPHWVKVTTMWEAMQAEDKDTGLPRGYMLLRKAGSPTVLFRWSESISFPINERSLFDLSSQRFFHQWNSFLKSSLDAERDDDELLKTSLNAFLTALQELKDGDILFTTQVDISCPESFASEHLCIVQELIKSVESTQIFKAVSDALCTNSSENLQMLSKAGKSVASVSCCKDSPCDLMLRLGAAHFLTMFLLSWNYQVSRNAGTYSKFLSGIVSKDLAHEKPNILVLENEIRQLRIQLIAILRYAKICQCQCDCH